MFQSHTQCLCTVEKDCIYADVTHSACVCVCVCVSMEVNHLSRLTPVLALGFRGNMKPRVNEAPDGRWSVGSQSKPGGSA